MPWGWEGHHGLSRQIVEREGGAVFDLRNRVPCPRVDHEAHTNGSARFPLALLPDSVFEFAAELLGPGKAYNALRREYVGEDRRLDTLLSTPETGD